MQDRHSWYKLALLACFSAVAIIFGYIESLIPFNFGIPGIKLGLSNLVTVVMLYTGNNAFKLKDILLVSLVRIFIVGLLFGNMYGIIYSLCGGIFSLFCMYFVKKIKTLGALSVSITGGITHNAAQLVIAVLVVNQLKIVYYAPVLLLAGCICGAVLGVLGGIISERLNKIQLIKL